ncbi:MAG: hypothetical protein U5L04_09885 [Trueperaceae bacterium]|nr:hypothetical protein [Trueperaceae bacterium]
MTNCSESYQPSDVWLAEMTALLYELSDEQIIVAGEPNLESFEDDDCDAYEPASNVS